MINNLIKHKKRYFLAIFLTVFTLAFNFVSNKYLAKNELYKMGDFMLKSEIKSNERLKNNEIIRQKNTITIAYKTELSKIINGKQDVDAEKPTKQLSNDQNEVKKQDKAEFKNQGVFNRLKNYIDTQTRKMKIFIPNITSEINGKFLQQNDNHGYGPFISYSNGTNIGCFFQDQFAVDLLLYGRIKNDHSVLVSDLSKANIVYLPIMLGYVCAMYYIDVNRQDPRFLDVFHKIAVWLKDNEEVLKGKQIMLVYSRVEGSLLYDCTMRNDTKQLLDKYAKNFHILSIEKYRLNMQSFNYTHWVLPYPTINKFFLKKNQAQYEYDLHIERPIDIFFTGNTRTNTAYRQFIFDNIEIKINKTYDEYKDKLYKKNGLMTAIYITGKYSRKTVTEPNDWKIHSKLCLEPYGDTPTRRSFWDSIMLGCIPVLFTKFPLPFIEHIDYSRFVVQLDLEETSVNTTDFKSLLEPHLQNTTWLDNARQYIKEVRQFIQYTWLYNEKTELIDPTFKYDAYGMALATFAETL